MKAIIKGLSVLLLFVSAGLTLADSISIENAYIREVPPGQTVSASFMVLKNDSDSTVALVKVSGDIAKSIELHEHVHNDGMMEMRQVEKINIPAKGETELKPGGFHIMLIGLTKKIKAGDEIQLNLIFDNGTKVLLKTSVKKIMQGMMNKSN